MRRDVEASATMHVARLGAVSYRVARVPLTGRVVEQGLCDSSYMAALDKSSLRRLLAAWAFAARSPRTITYLPVTRPTWAMASTGAFPVGTPDLDVLLVHHRLQLRPSAWRDIRSRLGVGHPTTLRPSVSATGVPRPAPQRTERARVTATTVSRTLVIRGDRDGFAADVEELRYLVEDAPAEHAVRPDWHQCAEVVGRSVHLEYASRRAAAGG